MRRGRAVIVRAGALFAVAGAFAAFPAAGAAATAYNAGTPALDGVLAGPWNTSQGDPTEGSPYQSADLFPTYTPGGNTTTAGGVTEPNLAVYPSASGATPYPSGVAGTPGPLPDYCSSGGPNPESGSHTSQPANTKLPMSPYYFPDVVRNAGGSLTGYFDWRPKDADEAVTVAKSTDDGVTWQTEGKALEQNPGYCPTADTNDDGEGHPYVMSVGGSSHLYTLQRPAGDNTGIGLLVHSVHPSAANPLSGLPASEQAGVDPNTFSTGSVTVPTSASGTTTAIPVSTLGSAGTVDSIVAGPYEDYNATDPSGSIITCTGTQSSPAELTGCSVAGGSSVSVGANDDLVQVIAQANPGTGSTYTIPFSTSQTPDGSSGLGTLALETNAAGLPDTTSESPITTYVMNVNAPNRLYIDGQTVYCAQSNANPTTKLENCTTTDPSGLTVQQGDGITADPVSPPTATMTTGLTAPDGIVGTLPSYQGAPTGSTVVLYTEKILNYFIVGTANGFVTSNTFTAATGGSKNKLELGTADGQTINYTPSVTTSEPLPASGSFTVYFGSTTAAGGGTSNPIQAVTCTGWTTSVPSGAPTGSVDLTGCSGGTGYVALGNWVGGPNAAVAPYSALEQIGEGNNSSSKGPEKLFGNNEDLTVLRAAYTTDGVNFHDLGPISGTASSAGNDSGSYNDVSNPNQQDSPDSSADPTTATVNPASPTNLAAGASDDIELRYVGSRGTIVTNPDGSLGMFLSGAWPSDGDSDAFNQIFYTSSTDGGKTWSVPKVVLSTDYTFAASAAQDTALAAGHDDPLGISAYYEGRAYGPAVVQNPDGTLTMVFSGYRLPTPIASAGSTFGTDSGDLYTVGATDPALYRNILTVGLKSSTSPGVKTSSALKSSANPITYGASVTYTDTVTVPAPGSGIPTGTVSFYDDGSPIAGCQKLALPVVKPDSVSCKTTPDGGSRSITAVYSGDSNYASSTGHLTEQVNRAPTRLSALSLINLGPPLSILQISATLTRSDMGAPIAGKAVKFTAAGAVLCSATTNSVGRASCPLSLANLLDVVLGFGYQASFAGDEDYAPASASAGLLGL